MTEHDHHFFLLVSPMGLARVTRLVASCPGRGQRRAVYEVTPGRYQVQTSMGNDFLEQGRPVGWELRLRL